MVIDSSLKTEVLVELMNYFNFRDKQAKTMIKTILANKNLLEGLFLVEKAHQFPNAVELSTNNSGGKKFVYYGENGEVYEDFSQFLFNVDYANLNEIFLQINFSSELEEKQQEVQKEYLQILESTRTLIQKQKEEIANKKNSIDRVIELSNLRRQMEKVDEEINQALSDMNEAMFREKTAAKKELQKRIDKINESNEISDVSDVPAEIESSNKKTAKYVYCFDEAMSKEMGYTIVAITTREYWEKHKHLQDMYTEADLRELQNFLTPHRIIETMESLYETEKSPSEIQSLFNQNPLFVYSDELSKLVNE